MIRFEHEMIKEDSGETAAVTRITAVHVDTGARRACPLPDAVLAKGRSLVESGPPPVDQP